MKKLHILCLVGMLALLVSNSFLQAAPQSWDGGGTNANWTTPENWSGDAVPGTTGANTADIATFNAAITNGWGESIGNAIRIDTPRAIGRIYFEGASGNYFLGNSTDSVLTLSQGTSIQINNTISSTSMVATILAPLEVDSIRTAATFLNGAASGSGVGAATLVIGGSFAVKTTSAFSLNLQGTSTNNNIVLSDLSNGLSSSLGINKTQFGKWVLAGDNSFTGAVNIGQGELSVRTLNSVLGGAATSNLGAPTTEAAGTIAIGSTTSYGVLRYTGAGETTDRVINLAGTTGSATIFHAGTGNLTFTSNLTATGDGNKTLFLGSSTTAQGRLNGNIVNSAGNATSVHKFGPGTWTLAGTNTYTGNTTVGGGTLRLDYGTNNTSKLSDTGVLVLGGGNLELAGGNHTETVGSTLLNSSINTNAAAFTTISRSSGNTTIALGALSSTSNRGVLNVQGENIATTTTANNAAGILATNNTDSTFAVTMNGADFARNDGANNIVAFTSYTAFTGSMGNNTVYQLTGNGSLTANMDTRGTWLKIDTTADGQSLNAGSFRQQFGAVLFTGAHNYTISSASASVGSYFPILNYGTGNLTVTRLGGFGLYHYGSGTTILQDQAVRAQGLYLSGGTVEVSNVLQLGTLTTNNTSNFLDGGTLRANTSGGDVTMANSGFFRNFMMGDNAGRFDVVGGGNLVISGTVSSVGTGRGMAIIGSNVSNGAVVFSGNNTYSGGTRLDGGTWRLDSLTAAGTGEILFNGGTLAFGSGIANDLSGQFAQTAGQAVKIDTNGNNVSFFVGINSDGGTLTKSGAGTLTLAGINSYDGATTVSVGTLLVDGSTHADSNVTVAAGAAIGGRGQIQGDLTLANGALFAFDTEYTLTLNGTLALDSSFGVASLRNLTGGAVNWSGIADGTYKLMNTSFTFNAGNISNFGVANAFNIGGGRTAYFENGSLDLVLVPEPATWALLGIGLTFVVVFRRRRRA